MRPGIDSPGDLRSTIRSNNKNSKLYNLGCGKPASGIAIVIAIAILPIQHF
jgi:hypothetical protein